MQMLADIVPILEPLAYATEMLTREDSPTAGCVYVMLKRIIDTDLQVTEADRGKSVARKLKQELASRLKDRFGLDVMGRPTVNTCRNNPLLLSTALDPRYKNLRMVSEESKELVISHLKALMEKVYSF